MITSRVLAAIAVTTIALGLPAGTRLPGGESERPTQITLTPPTPARVSTEVEPAVRVTPVRITIPHIDVVADVLPVGLDANSAMEVPADIRDVGWYAPTAPLTLESGSTVLVGHRDGRRDPNGVFRNLEDLEQGRTIKVLDSAGVPHEFRVESVTALPDAEFTDRARELFLSEGVSRLVLLTCGGEYVRDEGGYQSTIVVVATPK